MNYNPTPNIGKDGQTAPTFTMLVAGMDGSGNIQNLLVGTDGSLSSALTAAAPAVGQAKVAVTGTAVQLASNTLVNGVIITNNGTATVTLGGSSLTNTADGTGNGYVLAVGASVSSAVDNTNRIYINGTANTSWVSFMGS